MDFIMGGYFIGFVAGTFAIPECVKQVGHIRMFAALASMASIITLLHGLFIVPALLICAPNLGGVLCGGSLHRD